MKTFTGLQASLESAFPKKCAVCGYVYRSAEAFFSETQAVNSGLSCLKSALNNDGLAIVEVFRNCRCGSTLMDEFNCRRNISQTGLNQRQTFDHLYRILQKYPITDHDIRTEIIRFLNGNASKIPEWLDIESIDQ